MGAPYIYIYIYIYDISSLRVKLTKWKRSTKNASWHNWYYPGILPEGVEKIQLANLLLV